MAILIAIMSLVNNRNAALNDLYGALAPNVFVIRHVAFQTDSGILTDNDYTVLAVVDPESSKAITEPWLSVFSNCGADVAQCTDRWVSPAVLPHELTSEPVSSMPPGLRQEVRTLFVAGDTMCRTRVARANEGAPAYAHYKLICIEPAGGLMYYHAVDL